MARRRLPPVTGAAALTGLDRAWRLTPEIRRWRWRWRQRVWATTQPRARRRCRGIVAEHDVREACSGWRRRGGAWGHWRRGGGAGRGATPVRGGRGCVRESLKQIASLKPLAMRATDQRQLSHPCADRTAGWWMGGGILARPAEILC